MKNIEIVPINNPIIINPDSFELIDKIKPEIHIRFNQLADKYGSEEVLDVLEQLTGIKRGVIDDLLFDEQDIRLHLLKKVLACLKSLTAKDFKRPPIKPPEASIKKRTVRVKKEKLGTKL